MDATPSQKETLLLNSLEKKLEEEEAKLEREYEKDLPDIQAHLKADVRRIQLSARPRSSMPEWRVLRGQCP